MRPIVNDRPQPHPVTQTVPAPASADAQRALFAAIAFAPPGDLLPLLMDALAAGASFSERDAQGKDVLTIAVMNDRPHAIGTLLALGARLPFVPADGVDLLMQAAMLNHTECCHELITVAGLDPLQLDSEGRSALFHAVQSGATASARILLASGARPGQTTTRLSAESLLNLFGLNHQLQGRQVTPLMVATARSDNVMVDLLVDAGADTRAGDFPPLHVAADAHDPDMIQRLLNGGAEVAASLDWQTASPLETAIRSDAPMNCLRLLAADYPFAEDDVQDPDRPLVQAVKSGRYDVVALFLAHGAVPGDHVPGQASVWSLATTTQQGNPSAGQQRLHMLATTRASRWAEAGTHIDTAVLAYQAIVSADGDLATAASAGFYPSLLQGLQTRLSANPRDDDWQSVRQSALYAAAHGMMEFDTSDMATQGAQAGARVRQRQSDPTPDLAWQYRTQDGKAAQRLWLHAAATLLMTFNADRLMQALQPDFFRRMTDSCPDGTRLDKFIAAELAGSSGLPNSITNLIALSWYDAARHARQWHADDVGIEQANRFVAQHLLMLVAHRAEAQASTVPNRLSAQWLNDLQRVAEDNMALRSFAENPTAWLMRKEQRSHLRPVDTGALAIALGCELGLPPGACEAIATGWAEVIQRLSRSERYPMPDARWRAAATALSPVIVDAIVTNDVIFLSRKLRDLAERWCVQQTGPLPGRITVPVIGPVLAPAIEPGRTLVRNVNETAVAASAADGDALMVMTNTAPSSPAGNLTSPDGGGNTPPSPAMRVPPPRPPADRKRSAEPDTEPHKQARHQ